MVKDIAVPLKNAYSEAFLQKTNNILIRMRWKAFHYDMKTNRSKKAKLMDTYNIKSYKNPLPNLSLANSEKDLTQMFKNTKFPNYTNSFKKELLKTIEKNKSLT